MQRNPFLFLKSSGSFRLREASCHIGSAIGERQCGKDLECPPARCPWGTESWQQPQELSLYLDAPWLNLCGTATQAASWLQPGQCPASCIPEADIRISPLRLTSGQRRTVKLKGPLPLESSLCSSELFRCHLAPSVKMWKRDPCQFLMKGSNEKHCLTFSF